MSTRRQFLRDCSTAVAGLILVPLLPTGASPMARTGQPVGNPLSYLTLAGQINSLFQIQSASGQAVTLKLLKVPLASPTPVRPGRPLPGDAGNEKFSLVFSGPKNAVLPSAIHWLEHDHLGSLEMYLGQIGTPDEDSIRYEAVFNQPPPSALHAPTKI